MDTGQRHTNTRPLLFISYNHLDLEDVERAKTALEANGIDTFIDSQHLSPGLPWFDELEQALFSADGVAVFVGRHGLGRIQRREMWLALDRQASLEQAGRKLPVA